MKRVTLPALIKMSQVRDLTGLPRSVVYDLVRRGELEIRKVGSRSYIPRASFEAFLARLPRARYRNGRMEIVDPETDEPKPAV